MNIDLKSLDGTLAMLNSIESEIDAAIDNVFIELGKYVVGEIRNGNMSSWFNVTYNLLSSIGGAVCCKGRVIEMFGFEVVQGGDEGAEKGRETVRQLASQYAAHEHLLVIVAGEEYAIFVEAIEGKVVLSSSYLYIEKQLPTLVRDKIRDILRRYEK